VYSDPKMQQQQHTAKVRPSEPPPYSEPFLGGKMYGKDDSGVSINLDDEDDDTGKSCCCRPCCLMCCCCGPRLKCWQCCCFTTAVVALVVVVALASGLTIHVKVNVMTGEASSEDADEWDAKLTEDQQGISFAGVGGVGDEDNGDEGKGLVPERDLQGL